MMPSLRSVAIEIAGPIIPKAMRLDQDPADMYSR